MPDTRYISPAEYMPANDDSEAHIEYYCYGKQGLCGPRYGSTDVPSCGRCPYYDGSGGRYLKIVGRMPQSSSEQSWYFDDATGEIANRYSVAVGWYDSGHNVTVRDGLGSGATVVGRWNHDND